MPVGLGMVLVSVVLPCVDFAGEDFLVGDAAVQTLGRENAELGFWAPSGEVGEIAIGDTATDQQAACPNTRICVV